MQTSKTIKRKQYDPIEGKRNGDRWTFASESRDRVEYMVSRDDTSYRCGCPAVGLCKHITSAVLDDAKDKFEVVQVWTDKTDAKRQHRRIAEMMANDKTFWVTYARPTEQLVQDEIRQSLEAVFGPCDQTKAAMRTVAPEPAPTSRTVRVAFLWDRMTAPGEMDYWMVERPTVRNGDGTWRESKLALDDLLDLDGWTATAPQMVRGNERPGWHRFEFEMGETV